MPAKLIMPAARGFSLLETTVAITVLILAITGPLALASFTLSQASLSENEIVAFNLAEEGLELIINRRDSNVFAAQSWDSGFALCEGANGCRLDMAGGLPVACAPACENLHVGATGLYTYTAADPLSIFKRRITISPAGAAEEKRVKVTVTWEERFATHSFILESALFRRL